MEAILAIVEGPSTSEITSFDQIDHSVFQELLQKSSVWDFYEISKEEYMNKDDGEKKSLIVKYYNYMLRGKLLLFVSIVSLSEFCVSDIKLVCVVSVFSSMTSFSPVCFIVHYISSSEEKFCSVFDALLANDSSSEEKSSELKLSFEKTSTNRIYLF